MLNVIFFKVIFFDITQLSFKVKVFTFIMNIIYSYYPYYHHHFFFTNYYESSCQGLLFYQLIYLYTIQNLT